MSTRAKTTISPLLVGLIAWLIPGSGYFLLRERLRAVAVFFSVVILFILGILIGGIRIMDPPGWGQYGYQIQIVEHPINGHYELSRFDPISREQTTKPSLEGDRILASALFNSPTSEVGEKPWYVGQILCGPITLIASAISVAEARPDENAISAYGPIGLAPVESVPASHSRSWEIGTLYTAVAGMLNLLAVIDSTFLAATPAEETPEKLPEKSPGQSQPAGASA
jgi:hypothetical protein